MLDNTISLPEKAIAKESIPRKIHFIFLSKQEIMPEMFLHCIENVKALHPDWEVNFYNEDDAQNLIKAYFPQLIDLYNAYPHNVQRADIIRVIIVYIFGGFYLDLDMYCFKKLDPLCIFNLVLGEEKFLNESTCRGLNLKNQQRIANYMFGSVAGHKFWLDFLNSAIEKSSTIVTEENDILESTGPGLLTDFYHSKKHRYNDVVLLTNKDRVCLASGHKEIACHFGNYAAHLHLGTWRWRRNGDMPANKNDINTPHKIPIVEKNLIDDCTLAQIYLKTQDCFRTDNYDSSIYNILRKVTKPLEDPCSVSGETVLFFNNFDNCNKEISEDNTNVIYSTFLPVNVTDSHIGKINELFDYCIVPSEVLKESYRLNGIQIPTLIVEPGFSRYPRRFDTECDSGFFSIGCWAKYYTEDSLSTLIAACAELNNTLLPKIRINIYDPNKSFKKLIEGFEQTAIRELLVYTTDLLADWEMSDWFVESECVMFGADHQPSHLMLLECLYMGVPLIISNSDYYHDVAPINLSNAIVCFDTITNEGDVNNNKLGSIAKQKQAILKMYKDYDRYLDEAARLAQEIEDLYTEEHMEQKLISLLPTLKK